MQKFDVNGAATAPGADGLDTYTHDDAELHDVPPPDVERQLQRSESFYSDLIQGVQVHFQALGYKVFPRKNFFSKGVEKRLLTNVTGYLQPENMIALMGPSGCGKTTLLDVLAGRKTSGKMEGQLTFDGIKPTKKFWRRHTGYVEQFDTLCDNLTVYEMLLYTAELKLERTVGSKHKKYVANELLDFLGLSHVRDTRIGNASRRGVSGGQAKRVNIGVSLVSKPRLLFLDEPTTGLDSFISHEVMQFVKEKLAMRGMTVVASIHSPSPETFELFDQLFLLVAGRVVYFGKNGTHCSNHFSSTGLVPASCGEPNEWRLAEWVVGVVTSIGADPALLTAFSDAYEKSAAAEESLRTVTLRMATIKSGSDTLPPSASVTAPAGRAPSWFGRLTGRTSIVSSSSSVSGIRDKGTTVPTWYALQKLFWYRTLKNYQSPVFLSARVVDKFIMAFIIASLFGGFGQEDSTVLTGGLWMWSVQPCFGAAAYLPTFMLERNLYNREVSDGLYASYAYYYHKWVEEVPIAFLASLAFSLVVYYALHLSGSFLVFWFSFLMCLLAAIGTAFVFAALLPSLDLANGAVPSYGGTLLFFTGYLIPLTKIRSWWLFYTYTDYLRYPFTMTMINQFSNVEGGDQVLAFYGMNAPWMTTASQFSIMASFVITFFVLGLFSHMIVRYGAR